MGKHKNIKKGQTKALSISHPNSRKAKALSKHMLKNSKREKMRMESMLRRTLLVGEKFMWFRENLLPCETYTAPMLEQLFQKYLRRFDEELEQIQLKHSVGQRKNRQHASREDTIVLTKKREFEEYNTCGIEMVDILNTKQLKKLKEWDGDPNVEFKTRRFSKLFFEKHKPNQPNPDNFEPSSDEKKETGDVMENGEHMVVQTN